MKDLFKKYINSTLNPGEFNELEGFISKKQNDSTIYGLMKSFWYKKFVDDTIPPRKNPALLQKIKEGISLDKQKRIQRKLNFYTIGLRIAAILLIALIISNVFFYQKSSKTKYADQLQTITTPFGAKTNITLPDGSLVWLNSGSSLSYPSGFKNSRSVTLIGEAYFDVQKKDVPFIISTNYGEVEVKGTSFNIKAYKDDNSFVTTLVEGIIVMRGGNASKEYTLRPGQQGVKTAKGFSIQEVETRYFTSWKDGKLIFNREPFPSFIKKLERWYNVIIEYSSPELDELWYTGTIEMESISEVMEMISKSSPVTYSFDSKTRVFYIKEKN